MSLTALLATARNTFRYSCVVRTGARQCSTQQEATGQRPNDESGRRTDGNQYENDIRHKILEASLPFVKELGWSKEAITAGAESIGYPGVTHGMFNRAGGDLVLYFQQSSNKKLAEFLKKFSGELSDKQMAPAQFVETACKERLQMTIPYISKWPQALAIMALPPNVPTALATVLTMVDDICYYAGDRSVDFDWYARRVALAGVYKASELYMLQDSSSDYGETWKFLNRRLTEAVQLQDVLNKSDGLGQGAKDAISAAFTTARNILGLNKM